MIGFEGRFTSLALVVVSHVIFLAHLYLSTIANISELSILDTLFVQDDIVAFCRSHDSVMVSLLAYCNIISRSFLSFIQDTMVSRGLVGTSIHIGVQVGSLLKVFLSFLNVNLGFSML